MLRGNAVSQLKPGVSIQDADAHNQAKKAGTKRRPDPAPTGKSDYAGLAGVFFKER